LHAIVAGFAMRRPIDAAAGARGYVPRGSTALDLTLMAVLI
jgi:hypothetical protein